MCHKSKQENNNQNCRNFWGGLPEGPSTSSATLCVRVCVVLPKIASYQDEYSTLQTSTDARLAPEEEYKQLSMCTPPYLQVCNF